MSLGTRSPVDLLRDILSPVLEAEDWIPSLGSELALQGLMKASVSLWPITVFTDCHHLGQQWDQQDGRKRLEMEAKGRKKRAIIKEKKSVFT